jgi:hypothetical protein
MEFGAWNFSLPALVNLNQPYATINRDPTNGMTPHPETTLAMLNMWKTSKTNQIKTANKTSNKPSPPNIILGVIFILLS